MSDDPTEEEVKRLLDYMDSVMISHVRTNAIERFEIVWRDTLWQYAFELDAVGLRMSLLTEAPDGAAQSFWSYV